MEIKIIKDLISREELSRIAKEGFGDLIKAVVDLEQGIMAVGGQLHADEETILMEQRGSKRENTWGINIYPKNQDLEWIEFDSMVNIKPALGNRSRGIENKTIQEKIRRIVKRLISN